MINKNILVDCHLTPLMLTQCPLLAAGFFPTWIFTNLILFCCWIFSFRLRSETVASNKCLKLMLVLVFHSFFPSVFISLSLWWVLANRIFLSLLPASLKCMLQGRCSAPWGAVGASCDYVILSPSTLSLTPVVVWPRPTPLCVAR